MTDRSPITIAVSWLLLTTMFRSDLAAQISFGPERVVAAAGPVSARAVEVADLDGDADMDVIVASYIDGEVTAYENLAGGTFGEGVVLVTGQSGACDLAVGDIDDDGDVDIAYAAQLADRFAWLRNDGAMQFNAPIDIVTNLFYSNCATGIRLADINNDGTLDAMTCSCAGFGSLLWWANLGNGNSWGGVNPTIGTATGMTCLDAGDIDGDGWVDGLGGGSGLAWKMNEGTNFVTGPYHWGETGDPVVSSVSIGSAAPDGATIAYALPELDQVWIGQYSTTDPFSLTANGYVFQNVDAPSFVDQTPLGVLVISEGDNALYLNGSSTPTITDVLGGQDAAVADLDGDGDQDIVIASLYGCNLTWYQNTAGFFQPHCLDPLSSAYGEPSVADFNSDGLPDVLAPQYAGITWYQGLGADQFSAAIPIDLNARASGAAAADMDNDGDLDVVTITNDGDFVLNLPELIHIQWHPNDGNGAFGPPMMFADSFPDRYLALADMDGDGDMDVVTLRNWSPEHDILWVANNGDGTPGATTIFGPGGNITQLECFDVDDDGDTDVVVTDQTIGAIVYLNTGNGASFTATTLTGLVFQPGPPAPVDVDNDGIMDIVLANFITSRVDVFHGLGNGAFATIDTLVSSNGDHIGSVAFADLDGDGDDDMGIAYNDAGTLTVWANDGTGQFIDPVVVSTDVPLGRYLAFTEVGGDTVPDALIVSATRDAVLWFGGGEINTQVHAPPSNSPALHVWPVPVSTGTLYVDRRVSGNIADVHGRIVASITASNTIPVDALAAGMYVLRTAEAAVRFVVE